MKRLIENNWLRLVLVAMSAIGGVLFYLLVWLLESGASELTGAAPRWLSLLTNAGIEEATRLGLAMFIAVSIRKFGLQQGTASLAVVSSCLFAAIENATYLARFPVLDSYWRLGYAVPIHAGAALLYAITTAMPLRGISRLPALRPATPGPSVSGPLPLDTAEPGTAKPVQASFGRVTIVIVSFLAAWAWHAGFNIIAALSPFRALPVLGTALNLTALTALVVASAIRSGYWSLHERR
jgi:hypothetical protein